MGTQSPNCEYLVNDGYCLHGPDDYYQLCTACALLAEMQLSGIILAPLKPKLKRWQQLRRRRD